LLPAALLAAALCVYAYVGKSEFDIITCIWIVNLRAVIVSP
jgi:hypothetical protein